MEEGVPEEERGSIGGGGGGVEKKALLKPLTDRSSTTSRTGRKRCTRMAGKKIGKKGKRKCGGGKQGVNSNY